MSDPICCTMLLAIEWSLLQQTRPWRCSNGCSKDYQCFWMARMGLSTPKIALHLGGSAPPSNAWFLRPTRDFFQNDIWISSDVFAQLTIKYPITLQWVATFSPKLTLFLGDRVPHLTHGTSGLPESLRQTASRSVQPFSYGSQMLCCTMHCQWGRKPQNCPFPLGLRHPAGGELNHGDK